MIEVGLVIAASVLMWLRPARWPVWIGPFAAAAVAVVVGSIAFEDAARAVSDVRSALLFLVFAVPLAVTLDQIGVFGALAAMVDGGRHLVAGLWWLAAAVVVVFNLDAAVVLLTPLYIRIARRHGFDVEALAFQPALLACLASSVLPVSNLTNLIVAEQQHLGFYDFVTQLAPASLAATTVGFIAYRRVFHLHPTTDRVDDPVDPRALRRGLPIIAFVLAGFTVGDLAGISAWIVTAVALMWAAAWTRHVPWRAVPVAAIATTAGLVVVVAAAVPHLALDRWFDSPGTAGALRATGAATALSNLTNNLPVSLAASSSIEHPERSWPLLVGTNIGSIFVVTASLSTLLWRDTATRSGVFVSAGRWTAVAVRVGIPALVAATAVVAFVGR